MNQEKPHYDRIIFLTRQLSDGGIKVTRKRELSKELEGLFTNHDVRKKLAIETNPRKSVNGLSNAARRCQVLSMLWSNALTRSILTSKEILQSKSKIVIQDIRLPDRILRASSQPDEAFDSNGLGIPKLSTKCVRAALKFCLEVLQNESIPEGGEQVLLDMLVFLCSKDEYVGCFKYAVDFRNVLVEVFYRLTNEDEMAAPMIFELAAKAFGNLFCTCSRLGIEVHSFMSDSLQVVADWCKINLQRNTINSSSSSRQHFFDAVACMLFSHPDHAIGPMKRYGRHILRYCKRAYATAQGFHKEALNRYILAHLFVAQVAGKIHGLIDGDLGDLGSGSLTERQLVQLLELGINDIIRDFGKDANAVTVSRQRRQQNSNQSVWCPVDDRQKLQLEVVTRLLACAQRLYISRESWDALDDPNETLAALLKVPSSNKDGEWVEPELSEVQELSIEVQAKSPWVDLVLQKLMPPNFRSSTNEVGMNSTNEKSGSSQLENSLNSLMELISNDNTTDPITIPYLAIVGASAEFFPAGECWAMSATENWHRLTPEDKLREEVLWCHSSSVFDLVSLLSILSKLLEKYGLPESDPRVQYWILLVLTKLTETTVVLAQHLNKSKDNSQDFESLTMMWRTIWKTLLRSDLRYTSFTSLGENSLGEIFVILLSDIISRRCTEISSTTAGISEYNRESAFVREQQSSIWSLLLRKPAIFTNIRSRAQFVLISSISKFGGLVDPKHTEATKRPLRSELLHLTLCSLKEILAKRKELSLKSSAKIQLLQSIVHCIVSLVNGNCPCIPSRPSSDVRFFLTRCGLDFAFIRDDGQPTQRDNIIGFYFKLLWGNEERPHQDFYQSFFGLNQLNFDPPRLVAKKVRQLSLINERRLESHTCDFVSESDSEDLRCKVFTFVEEETPYLSMKTGLSAESVDGVVVGKKSQTVAAKLNLSLLVSQKSTNMDLLARIPDIITFFKTSILDLACSRFDPVEYLDIASNLLQICRFLIEVATRNPSKVDLSEQMMTPITQCQSLLKQYLLQCSSDSHNLSAGKALPLPKDDEDDANYDSEDEMSLSSVTSPENGTVRKSKKSKRRVLDGYDHGMKPMKRRKGNSSLVIPPNVQCAKAIGSLLIAMESSFCNCRLVCETILGTDIDVEPESIQGDMDLNSVKESLSFLCTKEVLLNNLANPKSVDEDDTEELSPTVMLCQIIDLVRQCAEPFSPFFAYGNFECAQIGVETLKLGLTLTSEEIEQIVSVLSAEDGMRSRFSLRAERAEAATHMFENGSNDFHKVFDKFFTNAIVKAGFDDPNFFLRRLASVAAGVASNKLDEQKILNSVSSRIAPIFSSGNTEETIGMFTDWYVRTGLCTTEEQDVSNIEAKDSLEAMESDSIYTKVLLAGSMIDRKSFIEVLQEILEISVARPGLEFMSYRALEKVAFMKGYCDVQELVDLEAESLLAVWMKKTRYTNENISTGFFPPTLTSPKAVWNLMLFGRYDYLFQNQFSPEPNEDSTNFRNQSAVNFVGRHRNFIIPFSLLKSHDAISQCKDIQSIIEVLSDVFGFRVLLAMRASREENERDAVCKILKRHVVAIQAMCTLLVHSDNDETKKSGQSILDMYSRLLMEKTTETKPNMNAPLLIRRLIQLSGQAKNLQGVMPFSDNSYYRAIKELTRTMGLSKALSGDTFIDAGTSLTEVTIYSYDKLMKTKLTDHQGFAWSRFVLLGEFLAYQLEDGRRQVQLDLFLHMLSEIVANTFFCKRIRAQALSLLQNVLRASLRLNQTELSREVCRAINKLVAVCFHLHEECQREIIYDLREKATRQKLDLRRSRGVKQLFDATWDLQSDRLVGPHELVQLVKTSLSAEMIHDCLVGTFDVLLWVVQSKDQLHLDCCVFANLSNAFEVDRLDMDILIKAHKRYCAQALGKALGESQKSGTLKQYISSLKHRVSRSRFVHDQKHRVDRDLRRLSCNHVTVHERLLCAELLKLENMLEEADLGDVLNSSDLRSLLGYLFAVGKTSSSSKVRATLSRCIALLNPSTLANASSLSNTDEVSSTSNYESIQLKLRARCIDCLAELLKSRKTGVAMAAVTTLEAIISNDASSSYFSMLAPTTVPLIKPFVFEKRAQKANSTALFNGEKKSLMKASGMRCSTGLEVNGTSWCWDQGFWMLNKRTTIHFEDWIRRLTPAIIVCCFNPNEMENPSGHEENSFFWHCQRVAHLDHEFASTIFPLLILTLLERRNKSSCHDQEMVILERSIANAFQTILFSWNRSDETSPSVNNDLKVKSLSIVIDTLDVLRKVSQGRFLSLKHRPNKSSTPKKSAKRGHNAGLDPLIPMQKVPFGVTLHMDGIIVAQACIEVKRFASALFFLEMYFNSQYGKSGGLFQELENAACCEDVMGKFMGVEDISGFKPSFKTERADDGGLKARTVRAMSMASRCYKELGEIELMHSTNMQLSSLDFTANAQRTTVDLDNLGCISSFDALQVLSSHSDQTSKVDIRFISSMTDSMEAVGLQGMINTYIEGVFAQNKDLKALVEIQVLREKWFENSLETQNWSRLSRELPTNKVSGPSLLTSLGNISSRDYFELVSESLNLLSNSDTMSSKLVLEEANSSVIDSLSDITGESLSPERFIGIVDKLRALQDVRKLIDDKVDLSKFDFDQMQALKVSSRIRQITLISLASNSEKTNAFERLRDHLWKTCDCAVLSGQTHLAETLLSRLKHLVNLRTESYDVNGEKYTEILRIRLQEAKIMECRGDFNGAIQRSKQLIRHIGDQCSDKVQECLLCDAQILCGAWMTRYKTQQAREILEQYLNPAANRAKLIFDDENTVANAKRATQVFIELGHKLANLHDDLLSRIHSKEWEETEIRLQHQHQQCLNSMEHRRELKREYGKLKKNSQRKEELHKHIMETESHFKRLEKEYNRTQKERTGIKLLLPQYLQQSLKSFISALQMAGTTSDDLSSHIFRMTSLWFSYQNDVTNDEVANDVMTEGLRKVPSFRFVTLTNQLFSRIDTGDGTTDKFQGTLQSLVFRMCNGHPYHCIAPLVTLLNGKVASKKRGVQQIIDQIEESGSRYVRDLLRTYSTLIAAYNDLAYVSTTKHHTSNKQRKKKIRFSEVFPSATTKSLDRCLNNLSVVPCVVTCPPHIRPGKDYGCGKDDPVGAERIAGFDSDFSITDSGVHRPKIVMCTGSKGGSFRQLVKGEDDIRQDAIMSQVFTYVNNLMKRKSNSRIRNDELRNLKTFAGHTRRSLTMITYNVLPLSPSSGVLEWVEGTLPIIDFIADRPSLGRIGAHSRYYPGEWSNNTCRLHLEKSPPDERRHSFDEICARHSPSLRYFFLERFGACMESWHIAKMNFTRSVAVSSIVGHILGIGDRHLGNILVDQGSGEVVHIDFGFVFEQGKLLPVPECVPFRLTRNMVDGMGPCGTEGLFVNVAEETMSLLRQHVQELLAILSAVVTDPLYKWSMNRSKSRQVQSNEVREIFYDPEDGSSDPSSYSKSQIATKTINKIKEKLQGYEDSTSGEQQGIEGQVQFLINSARDPNNLCKLFPGWGPWI